MFGSILIRKNLLVLIAIILVATSLSSLASLHSVQTSNEIRKIASKDIAATAENEAYDLSRIVTNKIDSVTTNLQVLASGPSVQSGISQDIGQLFDAAQSSTEEFTEYYVWIDSDGSIISGSDGARASYQYNSVWVSEKPSFLTEPQKTANIYYSNITKSPADSGERLYIAYPIIYSLQENENSLGDFRGVIVASIRLDTLGTIMTSELSPSFASDVSLADTSGEMVYSVDRSVIGKNVFEDPTYLTTPILTELTEGASIEITEFVSASNSRQRAEQATVNIDGKSFTIASHPIIQYGNHFWTLYITAPHIFSDNVDGLLSQQDTFTIITLMVIGAVSIGVAYIVLSWNRRLEGTVKARTLELSDANASLTKSNAQLALANEQLELHDKLQREFINVAAHELGTPIMPILGMTDLLESKFQQSGKEEIILKRIDFELISRNARRLERLAIDILDVAKIETKSLHLNKESCDLYELIDLSVKDIKHQFPNENVSYAIQMGRSIEVYADKSKLGQVLSNLLGNAAKFTDEGNITICAGIDGENRDKVLHISISDTGTGIAADVLPRLYKIC